MADYPSTGSTWLKELLSHVANDLGLPSPACDIYDEGKSWKEEVGGVRTSCMDIGAGNGTAPPSALVKTHYPSQGTTPKEGINGPKDSQYLSSMTFDRLLLLLRHPQSTRASNKKRWNANDKITSNTLGCWWLWWQRVAATLPAADILEVHYEELCLHTAREVARVLRFLGEGFAGVTDTEVEEALDKHEELSCKHRGHLTKDW